MAGGGRGAGGAHSKRMKGEVAFRFAQSKYPGDDACRGREQPFLFLISQGPSHRAQEAGIPQELALRERSSQDLELGVYRSPWDRGAWGSGLLGSDGFSAKGPAFPLCHTKHTEMPPGPLHSPSLDSFHESCLFLFLRWDILFSEKGVKATRQSDLGEMSPWLRTVHGPSW